VTTTDRDVMRRALRATPDCLPLERLAEELTAAERAHIAVCARCKAELDLWQELERATPAADEGAAVRWIVAELDRRSRSASAAPPQRLLSWLPRATRSWAAAFAALAVVATVGYFAWDREPSLNPVTNTDQTYRSARVRVLAPLGDVPSPPAVLEWVAPLGAVSYDVEVSEVDGTSLWRARSSTPRIEIAPSVVSQLKPGKTVLWQVRARDVSDTVIAESGAQRFRVEIPSRSPKS